MNRLACHPEHREGSAFSSVATLSALFLLASLLLPTPSFSQVATGTPAFASFGGGPEAINLGNLNAHWCIPVRHKPGRGANFDFDLCYNTSVWYPVGSSGNQTWQPVSNWGWSGQSGIVGGYISYDTVVNVTCTDQTVNEVPIDTIYDNWAYNDPFGAGHAFPGSTEVKITVLRNCQGKGTSTGLNAMASDGSGYNLKAGGATVTSLSSSAGRILRVPVNTPSGSSSITDPNGNQITTDGSGNFYDTFSSTTPVLTVAGSAPNNTTFSYPAPSGVSSSYTMSYVYYTVATNFALSNVTEYGATANYLVDKVTLPDGSFYQFSYEATPSTPSAHSCTPLAGTYSANCVTARITKITLPTSGYVAYSYSGGAGTNNSGIFADGATATLTRTVNDGTTSNTWTYARSQISGNQWQTLITDPATPSSNQTLIYFQKDSNTTTPTNNFYEVQRKPYQGSTGGTLLRQWTTCYNGNTSNCATTAVNSPITQRNVNDQYGSSGPQCQHNYFYDSVGSLMEQDDYDYGSLSPGSLLRKTLITYAPLGNITAFKQTVTVCNGSGTSTACVGTSGSITGTVVAQTNYNYDETTPTATSGIAQRTFVSGPRGNLTSINYPVNGLTSHFTYYDTGSPNTSQDVNGATTTYNYSNNTADCQMAFPTGVSEPLSMSRFMTWNCTGGVRLTATDENAKTTTTAYANDPFYWRPDSVTDPASAVVSFCYGLLSNSTGACTRNSTQVESTLNFNSGNSTVDSLLTVDGLGRPHVGQIRQSPSSTTFDSAETDYDALGRSHRGTLPYSGASGQTNSSASAVTTSYDALGRPLTVTDAGGGTATYSYSNNDVLITVGPPPSGENTKRRQLEYDSLGRLTSVCEITSGTTAWPAGSCGQTTAATGYLTKYTYDALGNLLTVTQNAQSSGNQQTRTFTYDALSRLTSEKNPEMNQIATSYTYDTVSSGTCAGTYSGDLVKLTDAVGNITCFTYDSLHRLLSKTYTVTGTTVATPNKYFVYDSATVNGVAMTNAKGRLAEAYTCTTCPGTKITDLGLGYTNRGETSDLYESTPHSSGFYHVAQTYWAHGALSQLTATYNGNPITGLPNITYGGAIGSTVGLDGKGRLTQVTAASGQNPVTGVSYNNNTSLPTQVNFGSGDSDIFAYDSNTLRQTQYKFNVGTQSKYYNLALTWNANGSLGQLAITDQFNSSDTQTCNYSHDDFSRIATANCGSAANQTFSYDPFGNISKSGSPNTFLPTYNVATNRFATIPGATPSYDANGNVLGDGSHTYTWDANGNSTSLDTVGLTFDAFDRMVEQNRSGSYTQIVYGPGGGKLALMNGQSLAQAFVPLPGQATAVYTSSGLNHYRHSDHLGSARLTSSPTQSTGFLSSLAYAPFGETYASFGTTDASFTGINPDTTGSITSSDYDFLFREYSNQGRWASPDPAGLAVVNPSNPQSWNRYSYVLNNPLALIDLSGLTCFAIDENGIITNQEVDGAANQDQCEKAHGIWIEVNTVVVVKGDGSGDGSSWTYWASGGDWGYLPSGDFLWAGPTSDAGDNSSGFFGGISFFNSSPCSAERRKAAVNGLVNIGIGVLKVAGGVALIGGTGGVGTAVGGYAIISGFVANIGGGISQIGGAITGNLQGGERGANAAAAGGSLFGLATYVGSRGNLQLAGTVGRVESLALSPLSLGHGGSLEGMNAARELIGQGNEPLNCAGN